MQTPLDPVHPVPLAPGLRVLRAPNPGPMTGPGTNTYLLGWRDIAVIDPGPDDPRHLGAILAAIGPQQHVTHIIVTHAHRDHSALAPGLSAATDAPVLAFGDALAGRNPDMDSFAAISLGGGEGVDTGFRPDQCIADGAEIVGDDWSLTALWTPGHMGNHLCLHRDGAIFTGDLVMGWASSLVSPPDGDMAAFYQSSARLDALRPRVLYPGHGDPVDDPSARIAELLAHRRKREAQIVAALDSADFLPLETIAARVYGDLAPGLFAAAQRNAFAHLIDLAIRGLVTADPAPSSGARFRRHDRGRKKSPQPTGRPPQPLL